MTASLERVVSPIDRLRLSPAFRKPKRITITLPEAIYRDLVHRSDSEGRSLSNLAAFLLEQSMGSQELVSH